MKTLVTVGAATLFAWSQLASCETETDADEDGWTVADGDCDDTNPEVYPGAEETCNLIDDDCDTEIDEIAQLAFYQDLDGDGYGNDSQVVNGCNADDTYVDRAGDCDDSRATVHPYALETCDQVDNNCNGLIDDGLVYADADGDGFGDLEQAVAVCEGGTGFAFDRGDCDHERADRYPGAADRSGDGIDSDCGGTDDADPHVGLSPQSVDSLQQALNQARDGQTVWVGPGTYLEYHIQMGGKAVALRSTRGQDQTVIDAERRGTVVLFTDREGPESLLEGFTLTRGVADIEDQSNFTHGGGLLVELAHPTLRQLTITDCSAGSQGGGAAFFSSSAAVSDLTLVDNTAGSSGGGISLENSFMTLSHVRARNNTSGDYGGAAYVLSGTSDFQYSAFTGNRSTRGGGIYSNGEVLLSNSEVHDNQATEDGGGLYMLGDSTYLTHVVLTGNSAERRGGAVLYASPGGSWAHLTVLNNSARSDGGGLFLNLTGVRIDHMVVMGNIGTGLSLYEAIPSIENSIIAYNTASYQVTVENNSSDGQIFENCALYAATGAIVNGYRLAPSNLIVEPDFQVDPEWSAAHQQWHFSSLHLATSSPLVNAGSASEEAADVDGSTADIGIYGGADGDGWDRDLDGYPDYFWPGAVTDAPTGYSSADYDADDLDPTAH